MPFKYNLPSLDCFFGFAHDLLFWENNLDARRFNILVCMDTAANVREEGTLTKNRLAAADGVNVVKRKHFASTDAI